MDNDKEKATWDPYTTKILIDVCAEQIMHKERQGTSFTRPDWNKIVMNFRERSGKMYDRKQLKNRFDILRKDWKLWEKLMSGETGIGYDVATNRVLAFDEWWQRKLMVDPNFRKFRHQGLMFASDLMKIFKNVVASGEYMYAPSSSQPQLAFAPHPDTEEEEDVYRVGLDQQEGSRDSEDENFGVDPIATAGVSDDFVGCNLNNPSSTGPSGSGSYGKRKRGETSDAKKKKKVAASTKISDSLSVIAAASEKRASALVEDPQQVEKIWGHLASLEELNGNPQLYYACAKMLTRLRWARRAYLGFMHDICKLLEWLIPATQDPDTWKGLVD
ncbi:L10-interacting MYB domain-containing protein-like [Neltuma alba]|uniref:L10-interacting MYB domain-containing protein-like n=1 Tax=Neltuma alba TaxID=207710 RepID=UPI0010A2DFD5|nr:L10-interacting MYB domain-containing protein-like [Prosopis alba]